MRAGSILCFMAATMITFSGGMASATHAADAGVQVKRIGGYYLGGKEVVLKDLPTTKGTYTKGGPEVTVDPNGEFQAGQMYVQFTQLSKPKGKYPLLLIHGGGLSGSTWENTPDGREGWQMYFLRQGHDVYVSDAVERGRSSWAQYPEINSSAPIFRSKAATWDLFRFGPRYDSGSSKHEAYPGGQFPVEALDQLMKQGIPRWLSSDAMVDAAYKEYFASFAKGCVVIAHSQGGNLSLRAAMANRKNIKAMVFLEPTGAPDPEKVDISLMKDLPQLFIWGDYVENSPQDWVKYRAGVRKYFDALQKAGAPVTWINLPEKGIKGNSHMLYMDKNSDVIAKIVQDWLAKQNMMR